MKKQFISLILACAAVTVVWAGGSQDKSQPAGEDYELIIGMSVEGGLCAAPFYIALEHKLYEEEGLKYTVYKMADPNLAMNHITSGTIDAAATGIFAKVVQPIANGLDIRVPLALHTGCVAVQVKPDSPIKTALDLKGKKIGVSSPNSGGKVLPARVLASLGLKPDGEGADVEWIIYPESELALVLDRGLVDAIGTHDPAATIAQNEGKARTIMSNATDDYLKDEFCCMLMLRPSVVTEHPEEAAKFVRAIQKASYFVQNNPDETARILVEKRYIAGDASVVAQVLKTFNYRASVSEALVAIERNARDLQKIGLLTGDVDVDALVKNTFVAIPGVPDSLF
jgi:NitT/TauT family transport system substrate-binding protein